MAVYPTHWLVALLRNLCLQRSDARFVRVQNPAGVSGNHIHCTVCNHLGAAAVVPNSIEYNPTGWRQFDIGFLVARIVTLVWCLVGLVGFLTLDILEIAAPIWTPRALLGCYVVAMAASVTYAVIYMTPFDNCQLLNVAGPPALNIDHPPNLPYTATATIACSHCASRFTNVTIVEIVPKTADPFR